MLVTFLRLTADGQEAVGHARLKKGHVVLEVPADLRDTVETVIIGSRRLTPADGEEYLRALPVAFSGSYFRAKLNENP